MQELIERMMKSAGIEQAQAEKALGVILNFISKEAPLEDIEPLLDAVPGARDLLKPSGGSGFSFGGLGAMAALGALNSAGLSMPQIQAAVREVVDFAREKLGEDQVRRIAAAIPGLGMFM